MSDVKINITELEPVESVSQGDTLLIVRPGDGGTHVARRVDATLFKGESAYTVAVENGFTGSYSDWERLVSDIVESSYKLALISDVDTSFDSDTGEIVVSVG